MNRIRGLILGIAVLGLGICLAAVDLVRRRERPGALEGRVRAAVKFVRPPSPSTAGGSGAVKDVAGPRFPAEVPPEDGLERLLAALARGDDASALGILEGWADSPAAPDPESLDRLLQACRGGHPAAFRAALIYRLASIDPESLRGIVPEILRIDPEPEVRRAAIQVAAELRGAEMRRAVLDAFADPEPAVRADAVSALACLKDGEPAAFDRVASALRAEPDAAARGQMAAALASLDDARVDPLLRELGLASAGDPVPGPKRLLVH